MKSIKLKILLIVVAVIVSVAVVTTIIICATKRPEGNYEKDNGTGIELPIIDPNV